MFDELQRVLRRLERGVSVSIQLPLDEGGYIDRKCSSEKCGVYFKVLGEDWFSEKVPDEAAFCPFCRHEEPAEDWTTPEQDEYIELVGMAHLEGRIDRALSTDSRRHNLRERSRPIGGLIDISMRMEYRPGPRRLVLPVQSTEVLRQEFECEQCECRWTSFGASFFCPGCGHNSAATTFDRTLEVVRQTVAGLTAMREALAATSSPEVAADAVRHVLEDQFSRLVGAFERVSEALFDQLQNASSHLKQGNVFQRVDDGSVLWQAASGRGYDAHLNAGEQRGLRLRFQQRHVLGHKQGIVDQPYIDRSGDTSYSVGQRLVIREQDVLELVDVVEKLVLGLRQVAQGTAGR